MIVEIGIGNFGGIKRREIGNLKRINPLVRADDFRKSTVRARQIGPCYASSEK